MTKIWYLLFLLGLAEISYARHEQYEGHQIFNIRGNREEITKLDGSLDLLGAKAINQQGSGILDVVVRIAPEETNKWFDYFTEHGIEFTKLADNLATILREEDVKVKNAKMNAQRSGRNITWDTYYRHDEINDYLDELGAEYPQFVTVINAGLSYEGRQIKYVRISSTRFEVLWKPVIIIDAAVHAREWVTPSVALYLMHQLVVERADERLLQDIDWIIIPVVNPDGYEYTFDEDRLWRKTRSRSHANSDRCPGVDGNRNFDHHWGTRADAAEPCALIYEGPSPFSEPETRVVRDAVTTHLSRTQLYIALHSYGNMFLYSWGNNATLPPNGLQLHLAGVTMASNIDALALPQSGNYVVGNAATVLYFTTGTSRDWTRAVGIPLTYTLELPGYDYGFVVPPEYIVQVVTETWAGIAAGAHFVLNNL